ncbi:MAG: hypothetical protein JWM68_2819, partial [Verrucomicrobiales bacterium]|nr:hypothetical protein [Verrucomicrobiales bacterium]
FGGNEQMDVLLPDLEPAHVQPRSFKGGGTAHFRQPKRIAIERNGALRIGDDDRHVVDVRELHSGSLGVPQASRRE